MELTKALMELIGAAAGRRVARKALTEATEKVADEIAEAGRSGDRVTVEGVTYRITRLWCEGRQGPGWPIQINRLNKRYLVVADRSILSDIDDYWHDGQNQQHGTGNYSFNEDDPEFDVRSAGAEERVRFASHAGAVIKGFADLYVTQASQYQQAAEVAVRIVPR